MSYKKQAIDIICDFYEIIAYQGAYKLNDVTKEHVHSNYWVYEKEPRWITAHLCAVKSVENTIKALEEYDNTTEKDLKEQFPTYFSCQLQNMDSDFRHWGKILIELKQLI